MSRHRPIQYRPVKAVAQFWRKTGRPGNQIAISPCCIVNGFLENSREDRNDAVALRRRHDQMRLTIAKPHSSGWFNLS
ncbi:hypothetical protein [Bosea sp. (in: a-proteobacteria)]|uniref:hypothetical protein n=1 Tax=Bosea sp. (in: a-proteobacteria) TaxID=1871050 RepID=UPI003F71EBD1